MASFLERVYRACLPEQRVLTYRVAGLWPHYSAEDCYAQIADDVGNRVRIESIPPPPNVFENVPLSNEGSFALASGDHDIKVTMVIPECALAQPGSVDFAITGVDPSNPPYIDGFQAECYTTREPPPFSYKGHDIDSRYEMALHARVVEACYLDIDKARDVIESFGGPDAQFAGFAPAASPGTGVLMMDTPNRVYMWGMGTTSDEQLQRQSIQFTRGPTNYGRYSTSQIWVEGALLASELFSVLSIPPDKPVFCSGHSMGGCIAALAAMWRKRDSSSANVELLTFAMPRPGDIRTVGFINSLNRTVHIQADRDPVPWLPPHSDEMPWLFQNALLRPIAVNHLDKYLSPRNRYALYDDGSLIEGGLLEPLVDLVTAWALAAVAGGPFPPLGPNHSMQRYRRLLEIIS